MDGFPQNNQISATPNSKLMPIGTYISVTNLNLDRVDQLIIRLFEKLQPVLTPEEPNGSQSKDNDKKIESEIADNIRKICDRVKINADALEFILKRLEV